MIIFLSQTITRCITIVIGPTVFSLLLLLHTLYQYSFYGNYFTEGASHLTHFLGVFFFLSGCAFLGHCVVTVSLFPMPQSTDGSTQSHKDAETGRKALLRWCCILTSLAMILQGWTSLGDHVVTLHLFPLSHCAEWLQVLINVHTVGKIFWHGYQTHASLGHSIVATHFFPLSLCSDSTVSQRCAD